jgi:tetratricopeptide (TPR) repeat protein
MLLAHLGGGLTSLREQRFEEAVAWLEVALRMSESPNLGAWWAAAGSPLGRAWVGLGRVEEAIALLEQVVARTVSSRGSGHVLRSLHLAEAYCLAGRADEALHIATDALELAREYGEQGHEAYALLLLGQLATEAGSEGDAINYLQAALDIARYLGMKPLEARVYALLAQCPGVVQPSSHEPSAPEEAHSTMSQA